MLCSGSSRCARYWYFVPVAFLSSPALTRLDAGVDLDPALISACSVSAASLSHAHLLNFFVADILDLDTLAAVHDFAAPGCAVVIAMYLQHCSCVKTARHASDVALVSRYLLPEALRKLLPRIHVSFLLLCPSSSEFSLVQLTGAQLWLAAGATVVSLKWAVPNLQEQEARNGFYVYTAAVADALTPPPTMPFPCTPHSPTAPSNSAHRRNIASVTQGSVDDFFSALEVSSTIAFFRDNSFG